MGKNIRVLMVDDEKRFRATTKKILTKKGFEAILADSGEEAIEKLLQNPDVVVLDIKMPGMDGHQALKEIKKRSPNLPVIMLTGHGSLPSAREAHEEGAFDYLSKPCDITVLTDKIREAYQHGDRPRTIEEKRILGVMVPIMEYTVLTGEETVKEAVSILRESFVSRLSTSRIMETGHRSILVMDEQKNVTGILTIMDLLVSVLPSYLSAAKPSTADSIQYSPMFWKGMFIKAVEDNSSLKIKEIMSPTPLTIDANNARRLITILSGKVAGIIREQDLFFEIEKILKRFGAKS
ncbi:MAG: response regulator [Deltaproteobacteria bacterium]|nr:response regulator [Deltaproteobacteria bacterium]